MIIYLNINVLHAVHERQNNDGINRWLNKKNYSIGEEKAQNNKQINIKAIISLQFSFQWGRKIAVWNKQIVFFGRRRLIGNNCITNIGTIYILENSTALINKLQLFFSTNLGFFFNLIFQKLAERLILKLSTCMIKVDMKIYYEI